MAVILFNHIRKEIMQRLREGMDMRDIRDPQEIGEVLLARGKGVSIIEAADDLPGQFIRRYGESLEQANERWQEIQALTHKPSANGE